MLNTKNSRTFLFSVLASLIILAAVAAGYLVMTANNEVRLAGEDSNLDLSALMAALEKGQIDYRLDQENGSIYVPSADGRSARMLVADLRRPDGPNVGLEIFEKSDFGITEFAQKVNYKRAIEGELARTFSALSGVNHARVHLALPEKSFFKNKAAEGSASVTLFLADGTRFNEADVTSIQSLVSHSVAGIEAQNVIVMDQTGRAYSSQGERNGKGSGLKEDQEYYLKEKVSDFLLGTYPTIRHSVGVNVDVISTDKKVVERTLVPLSGTRGAIKSSKVSLEGGKENEARGKVVEESYEFGSRVEETRLPAGDVTKVSVAVYVDAALDDEERIFLQESIAAIAGIDTSRGDLVVVRGAVTASTSSVDAVIQHTAVAPEHVRNDVSEIDDTSLIQASWAQDLSVANYQWIIVALVLVTLMLIAMFAYFMTRANLTLSEDQELALRETLKELKGR